MIKRFISIKYTILFSFFCLFFSAILNAQGIDYQEVRDRYSTLSCGPVDSNTIKNTIDKLENADTMKFVKNIQLYYRDLGWAYYRIYMYRKDSTLLNKCISLYKQGLYHQPDWGIMYWDMAIFYGFLNRCDDAKNSMLCYMELTRRKFWPKDQIRIFEKKCGKVGKVRMKKRATSLRLKTSG